MADYTKLAGSSGLLERTMLYMGDDHVMRVEVNGVTENYKRMPFTEIEAIVLQRTHAFVLWAVVWGLVLLGGIVAQVSLMQVERDAGGFALLTVLPPLVLLVVHLVMGKSCKVVLQTAVQQVELPLTRLPKARRVIAKIQSQVEAAQGRWSDEILEGYVPRPFEIPPKVRGSLRAHRWLYITLGAEALVTFAAIGFSSHFTVIIILLLNAAVSVIALFAVKDGMKNTSSALRWLVGITFATKTIMLTVLLTLPSVLEEPGNVFANSERIAFDFYANQVPTSSLAAMVCYIAVAGIWATIAISGLLAVSAESRRRQAADAEAV